MELRGMGREGEEMKSLLGDGVTFSVWEKLFLAFQWSRLNAQRKIE